MNVFSLEKFKRRNSTLYSSLLLFTLLLLNLMILIRSSLIILGLAGKASSCNAGDLDSIPGLGKASGEGKGYPLQYSGLENSMDCIVHRVAKRRTWLSDFHMVQSRCTHKKVSCFFCCCSVSVFYLSRQWRGASVGSQ